MRTGGDDVAAVRRTGMRLALEAACVAVLVSCCQFSAGLPPSLHI